MGQNHGFNKPSNERAKLFTKGKNSGPSGQNMHIPNITPMPSHRPPPPAPTPIQLSKVIDPTHDYILVHIIAKNMSEGGIHLPESAQEKESSRAIVLKVGPGRMTESGAFIKPCCEVGDRVFIAPNPTSMIPIQVEDMTLLLVNNIMVLGIYPKEKEDKKEKVQSTEGK